MNKKQALIFAILLTLLVAGDSYILSENNKKENVIVERVIDGDTFKTLDGRTIRLLNINAPEKNTASYVKAYEFLKKFENKTIQIEFSGVDKYKRYLGRIYFNDYLNLKLVEEGLASKFLVDENEIKKFADAEKKAIENEKGIWKKSSYWGCFTIKINYKYEMVDIKNNCPSINVNGWMIKDESRKIYTFQSFIIGEVIIHSGSGKDNSTDLFWNAGDVWNNDRDSLYFFDEKGEIAGYEVYGY